MGQPSKRRRKKTFPEWKADFIRANYHFQDETFDLSNYDFFTAYNGYLAAVAFLEKRDRDKEAMARDNEHDSSDDETKNSSKPTGPSPSIEVAGGAAEGANPIEALTETKAPELVKLDPSEVGMSAGLKQLFSGKEDKRGRFQWQTKPPEDIGVPAEDAESEKWAIIVRNVKVYHDPKKVLSMHSIVVQSPLLKDLLTQVLSSYPGVTVDLKRLEFSGRFEPLIHRWPELKAAIEALKQEKREKDAHVSAVSNGETNGDGSAAKDHANGVVDHSPTKTAAAQADDTKKETSQDDDPLTKRIKHAELLHDLLVKEFTETIESSLDMKTKGVMTYDLLWTLFQPGSLIYSKQQGQDRVFRLTSSRYGMDRNGNPVFWVMCQYIDYDGTSFGTNKLNMSIASYEGTRPIINLPTFPFEFHGHKSDIEAKLIERGEKVETLAGSHYRGYQGIGWRTGNMGQKEKYTIKGRIVIDTHGWNRFNPNMAIYVTPLNVKNASPSGLLFGDSFSGSGLPSPVGNDDEYDEGYDIEDGGMPMDGAFEDDEEEPKSKTPLTRDQKLMCSPLVRGYALKEKLWLNFFVNAVQEITFNERAFDSLVLPKNQKDLVLGFTSTQQGYCSQFDDVIEGKGRGIILLLCGPPGVGKTLTAESVAEEMRVPLFMMSAGDLGIDPRSVESKLNGILDMCTRWNAILLLDEADVFLEERSLHELERNKLVSIFLRTLEYYEGIMFLTTNRVSTFDQAFQSRIHISIEYKELDIKSRKTVWQNFLRQHDVAQAASRERPPKPLSSAAKYEVKPRTNSVTSQSAPKNDEPVITEEAKQLHLKRTLPHEMTERDINKLASMSMNGRQIKNILKTAQLLASQRGEGLNFRHVDTVMDVTQHLHNASRESQQTKSSLFS